MNSSEKGSFAGEGIPCQHDLFLAVSEAFELDRHRAAAGFHLCEASQRVPDDDTPVFFFSGGFIRIGNGRIPLAVALDFKLIAGQAECPRPGNPERFGPFEEKGPG